MSHRRGVRFAALALALGVAAPAVAKEQPFKELVGPVKVAPVKGTSPLTVPFITWGGDTATFHANGGLKTASGSTYQKLGLNLDLKAGDDFVQQVRDYMSGKSPFLRGTFRMIGQASEVIGSDARTKGVVILQLTWSAGDHMVGRSTIKTLNDLKGKKVALQTGGPHVGMLDDVLRAAKIGWDDIQVVWAKELTGPGGPADLLRKDASIDACFAITPDMLGLCGGLSGTGSGAEGTVKGARVVISTAQLSRSIADVYVCRKDFYDQHRELVAKFVAGYLKGCEDVVALKKKYEASGSPEYMKLLQMTQKIYGEEVIPTLEEDAHGLISDCSFVGYPGNVSFFEDEKNAVGFEAFQKAALDLATERGYAGVRSGLFPSGLDYKSGTFKGLLQNTEVSGPKERFRAEAALSEIEELSSGEELDDRTLLSFTISFEPNQTDFTHEAYGQEFQRVVDLASKFGNAVIAIRGHADPTKGLVDLIKSGMKKGLLKRSGSRGNWTYYFRGRPLDLSQTKEVIKLIESGAFDGSDPNPRETIQAALNLSKLRAEQVRDSLVSYAAKHGLRIDKSQVQPVGVGVREPLIPKPSTMDEARQNMRVEFRLVKVPAEVIKESDFDY